MSQLINFLDFVNEQFAPEQVSSHDELSDLTWFGHFTLLHEALGSSVQWSTGAKAYANGTRVLTVTDQQRAHKEHYRFYPLKGTIYRDDTCILRDIKLISLLDWEDAFEKMWVQKVSQVLDVNRHLRVRRALESGDLPQFEQWIEKVNQSRAAVSYLDPLPENLIIAISTAFASPEEREAIAYLRSVGLM